MKGHPKYSVIVLLAMCCCQVKSDQTQLRSEVQSLNLLSVDITLCGPETRFGKVDFGLSCSAKVRANFNLATALLHSFEYPEAEKIFAKVIDEDPECIMAYWGVAMSNFHPLWAPPTPEELRKGSGIIAIARSLDTKSEKDSEYLEAAATLYDDWD